MSVFLTLCPYAMLAYNSYDHLKNGKGNLREVERWICRLYLIHILSATQPCHMTKILVFTSPQITINHTLLPFNCCHFIFLLLWPL